MYDALISLHWLRVPDVSSIALHSAALRLVSVQTQSLALRALRKRKPQETQSLACVDKQPIMVATASTEHSYWLALAFVAEQTQAPANARSKQWQT